MTTESPETLTKAEAGVLLPPATASAISERELQKILVCRHLLPDPAPDVVGQLVSEIQRLRDVLKIIRDYYSGAGYIGAMADDALKSPNEREQS